MFTRKLNNTRVDCNITCTHFYKLTNNKFAAVKYLFCNSTVIVFVFRSSTEDKALWNNTPVNIVQNYKYVNSNSNACLSPCV